MSQRTTDDPSAYQRYLSLLGLTAQPPTLSFLTALVEAHIDRIPFENISKILFFRRNGFTGVLPLAQYLDGIEQHHFGGTCYANASHFNRLLRSLGFNAHLCGADMSEPDVHAVNIVDIDGREYLIDVGYGAPLWSPLPLDTPSDIAVDFADDRYVLHPRNPDRTSRLDHLRHGAVIHGYTAKPTPRALAFFAIPITNSFRPTAQFLNTLTVARYSRRESVVIRPHLMLREIDGKLTRQTITSRASLYQLVERHFGIPLPLIAEALDPLPFEFIPTSH